MPIAVDNAHRFDFAHDSFTYPVYRDGRGPGVLILHELPGMSDECIRLGGLVMDERFTVYMPLFFGSPGMKSDLRGGLAVAKMCVRHEMECIATDKTSRLTTWLQALCRQMHQECGGPGVGVIGMCFTGGIVLSVMLDESVLVPVISQPALPMHQIPVLRGPSPDERKRSLGIAPEDLELAKRRAERAPILAYRFKSDTKCPSERFTTLRTAFGTNVWPTEIPTGPDNPGNIPDKSHSVLTQAFVNEAGHPTRAALDEILARFKRMLKH